MKRQLLVPKISGDIEFHKFSSDSFFIHQKVHDHRVKISADFYELLKKVDGKKTLRAISSELGPDIYSVDMLYEILYDRLGTYGVIENDNIEVKPKTKPNYLKLSFIVIPAKTIAKFTPYLKFLFKPMVFKVVMLLCTCIILFGLISNFDVLKNLDIEAIWLQLLIFGFVSVTFHEFGHATAAQFYGAKHGGIGGGFYLFSPVYFADVTDIWKLKPRKRIVVNLAGIYFEMIVCSIYILIATIFKVNFLSIVGLFIAINTLFNLNPFLRSDGYWVLTDLLEISNLFKKSSQALREILKAIFLSKTVEVSKFNILLAIYASVNYFFIGAFIYYLTIFNPNSVLYFPINIYEFLKNVFHGIEDLTLSKLSEFIIPALFYYLILKIIIKQFAKVPVRKIWRLKGKHSCLE